MNPEGDSMPSWAKLEDLTPAIDDLARTAAANGMTIYALEPEEPLSIYNNGITASSKTAGSTLNAGMANKMFGAQAPSPVKSKVSRPAMQPGNSHLSAARSLPQHMFIELQNYKGQTLTSLAEKTGGRWFRGPGTIDDVFQQISSDLSSYYSIAYRATQPTGKARRVEVKVRNRPELRVRTRSEVIDKSPEKEMSDLVLSSLLIPRESNELRLNVTAGTPAKEGDGYSVPVDIVLPLEALTFVPMADGRYGANLDVHFAVTGLKASFTRTGRHQQGIAISADQYAKRAGVTFRFKTHIDVGRGEMRIALGVMDPASRLTGFRTVEVNAL
jgi:hypothetical protein